jgi:hypothetical protein
MSVSVPQLTFLTARAACLSPSHIQLNIDYMAATLLFFTSIKITISEFSVFKLLSENKIPGPYIMCARIAPIS